MLDLQIVCADVRDFDCDVLVLKYAQSFNGADLSVANVMFPNGAQGQTGFMPKPGEQSLVSTAGAISAKKVLFTGVVPLHKFEYAEIREFTRRSLNFLRESPARHIAMTLHGVGYGLDERESFLAQLGGIADSFSQLISVRQISFVERTSRRAQRLQAILEQTWPWASKPDGTSPAVRIPQTTAATITAGTGSRAKPHIFVAMPFSRELEDVFVFGIQGPINTAGLLCERMDTITFAGDILERMKKRIESAALVIADLTGANPNVYLEVGYAWGKGRPTLFLSRKTEQLEFDVRGHRCIKYESIFDLANKLNHDLSLLEFDCFTQRPQRSKKKRGADGSSP